MTSAKAKVAKPQTFSQMIFSSSSQFISWSVIIPRNSHDSSLNHSFAKWTSEMKFQNMLWETEKPLIFLSNSMEKKKIAAIFCWIWIYKNSLNAHWTNWRIFKILRNHWFINIREETTTNFLLDIRLRIGTYIRAELINDAFLS